MCVRGAVGGEMEEIDECGDGENSEAFDERV